MGSAAIEKGQHTLLAYPVGLGHARVAVQFGHASVAVRFGHAKVAVQFGKANVAVQFANANVAERFGHAKVTVQFGDAKVAVVFGHASVAVQFGVAQVVVQLNDAKVAVQSPKSPPSIHTIEAGASPSSLLPLSDVALLLPSTLGAARGPGATPRRPPGLRHPTRPSKRRSIPPSLLLAATTSSRCSGVNTWDLTMAELSSARRGCRLEGGMSFSRATCTSHVAVSV